MMRVYLRNQELRTKANQLALEKNPRLIHIYAQLYTYKRNPDHPGLQKLKDVLALPGRLAFCFVNLLLALAALGYMAYLWQQPVHPAWMPYACAGLVLCLCFVLVKSLMLYGLFRRLWDYYLVDELMERGWIKLNRSL